MDVKKVLFINQEMSPYLPSSLMSDTGRYLPQAIQQSGCEIRTFMPKWGCINERRNQLHEVIRLSGMNIIIDDTDHPLIIKVASISAARMQVYFIDNDEYFRKRGMIAEADGKECPDNLERAVFYARGVIETTKKLCWVPDVVYCQGWMAAIAPYLLKTAYKDDPAFANAKVVFAAYEDFPKLQPQPNFPNCLNFNTATSKDVEKKGIKLDEPDALWKLAVEYADALIVGDEGVNEELIKMAQEKNLPILMKPAAENMGESYGNFFNALG